jgi:phosphohistidine phosphatase
MNLFLLRHGLAVEPGTPGYTTDAARPLTPVGERKLWRIAEAMSAMKLSFDLICSSPYLRARQTAEIVAEAFHARRKLTFLDQLVPGGSAKGLIAELNRFSPTPDEILLVGHEPSMSGLISLLVFGDPDCSVQMKKAGLAKLSCESLKAGKCATLEWLLTPKQMSLMS